MAQIKSFGLRELTNANRERICDAIHGSMMDAFDNPKEKRFRRFFPMSREDFIFPDNQTEKYIIIVISMFEGRTVEAKKKFFRLLFSRLKESCEIEYNDAEITIPESPRHHWGIRGTPGEELKLDCEITV